MKILKWVGDNILFLITLFLLVFIPLYPKIPLIDISHTWVYVRLEDVLVGGAFLVWGVQLLRKKISLKTPITVPIFVFWIIGAVATIHGVLLVFPELANVFPNVALLSFLRRIEYLGLFFVAFSAMRDKRFLPYVIAALLVTLFGVVTYGMGQKYLGFPAYLTMNEEFAKGIPIQLSQLSRVPSTFGGHYDLAAYLVLVIPIFASLLFGIRNFIIRAILAAAVLSGIVLLLMTVSRISFFVLFIALFVVLFFQKKKLILFILPIIGVAVALIFLMFSTTLLDRFGNTVREIDVLVDADTGQAIGHIQKIPVEEYRDKTILRKVFQGHYQLSLQTINMDEVREASPSALVSVEALPQEIVLVASPNAPTGENLPQGTGYINLSLSPVTRRMGEFFYNNPDLEASPSVAIMFTGDFLIKRAAAYDLSFTTRYQGEWPHAIEAFKKNILFGSGYASISLAIDNNYLRILGEVGSLGFISFVAIFVIIGIYIRKVFPHIDSPVVKSFVVGFVAGVIGLSLNALLIDVFEASKVAYLLWLLSGITIGVLHFYQRGSIDIYREFKEALISKYAIVLYLLVVSVLIFTPMIRNYFVGDDFTWLRWAADCGGTMQNPTSCPSVGARILSYFTSADGFFYRPGAKVYFLLMYSVFWLNQAMYHLVSVLLHFIVTVLLFFLTRKVLKDNLLAALSAFLFLILSGYSEAVFWISATGYLFSGIFILLSLLFYGMWEEKKKVRYFVVSLLSGSFALLFHEYGIVVPFLIILYHYVTTEHFHLLRFVKNTKYLLMWVPILIYLVLRFLAQSHWSGGDYSYNLLKLPFNIVGNAIGYFFLSLFGTLSLPFYQALRSFSRENIIIIAVVFLVVGALFFLGYRFIFKKVEKENRKIIIFAALFFLVALLPFLGFGNIASRYSYLASMGVILLLMFFMKKLYTYLLSYGRDIAITASVAILSVFYLLQIIQIQQIHSNWYEAGEKVRRFFVSIDGLYANYWSNEPVEFHFVDVPTRVGEAWVFPVGLPDALWFTLRNPEVRVYQWPTVEEALKGIGGYESVVERRKKPLFKFREDGSVEEVMITKKLLLAPNSTQ